VSRAARNALAATITRLARELSEARAIINGRAAPPTDAEIAAHHAAGGTWLVDGSVWLIWPEPTGIVLRRPHCEDTRGDIARSRIDAHAGRVWVPISAHDRPCAWPEVQP